MDRTGVRCDRIAFGVGPRVILKRGLVSAMSVPSAELVSQLVERICASSQFEKSPRSQELLRYLSDCSLKDPAASITEHQVGVALFGWRQDLDPGSDTIVRVQVSQLRKKLEHYFVTDGRDEPTVIHIPRGSYAPAFDLREHALQEAESPHILPLVLPGPVPVPAAPRRSFLSAVILSSAATALVVSAAFLIYGRATADHVATPALDRFWSGFRNGRAAEVVVTDANLAMFSDVVGHMISLNDYRTGYPREQLDGIQDSQTRRFAEAMVRTHNTGMQDASTLAGLSLLLSRYRVAVNAISARDFRMPQPDNLVLLGHPKGNPWIRLFDDRLNFRYDYDWQAQTGKIVNQAPHSGEQASYTADFGKEGYCVVACLPKPMHQGTALLIYGSDLSSLEAGGHFVCDENSIAQLYKRLGVTPGKAPPYLEVLLKTKLLENLAPEFEIIAHRIPKV